MTDETIQHMQTILAHQEAQIQDLSDMLNLQRKEIGVLKARLDKTQRKLVDLEQAGGEGNKNQDLSVAEQALLDKPPHY